MLTKDAGPGYAWRAKNEADADDGALFERVGVDA